MSIWSWTVIFQKHTILKQAKQSWTVFERLFWSGKDMPELFQMLKARKDDGTRLFVQGFKAFLKVEPLRHVGVENKLMSVQRAVRVSAMQLADKYEDGLGVLATIGSVSPYIGLFGTVWGIMNAFQSLGHMQQATLAAVAPGISEALVATAMGLFAAIPAVIAYNRLTMRTDNLLNSFDNFQETFVDILHRQLYAQQEED
jgi:biopolymer transport protein TolQ